MENNEEFKIHADRLSNPTPRLRLEPLNAQIVSFNDESEIPHEDSDLLSEDSNRSVRIFDASQPRDLAKRIVKTVKKIQNSLFYYLIIAYQWNRM